MWGNYNELFCNNKVYHKKRIKCRRCFNTQKNNGFKYKNELVIQVVFIFF